MTHSREDIEKWFQCHFDWLVKYAERLSNNSDDALEVVANVFLYVLRHLDGLPPILTSEEARGLLRYRVYCEVTKLYARRKRTSGTSSLDAMPDDGSTPASTEESPKDQAIRAEDCARLRAAISRLETPEREIILLRHFEGLTFVEIGEQLGMPESTARSRNLRATINLRAILARGLKPEPEEEVADDAVRLGEFRGRIVTKHPKPGTGKQPFIRWNGHEVKFKGEAFDTLTLEQALALLHKHAKVPDGA